MKLTQERLKEVLDYDPSSGAFTWKVQKSHRTRVGLEAAPLNDNGYIRICIDYQKHYAHRLAWLWMTGEWPKDQIDHKNLDRTDNRWDNLRQATYQLNSENQRKARCTSKVGLLGVSKRNSKFAARIKCDGGEVHLGVFDTAEMAHDAYIAAKRKLHAGCTI